MRIGVAGLGLLVLCAGAPPAAAQAGRTEVADVRFEGNEAFPDDSLARAIITRGPRCSSFLLSPFCWVGLDFARQVSYLRGAELPRDALRLRIWYQRRGFREADATVDTTLTDGGRVEVMFHVVEGRPVIVDSIAIQGSEAVSDPSVLEDLPLRVGDRLSSLGLDVARNTLVRRLTNRGFAQADVLLSHFIPADSYTARVTFDVAPGPRARYGHVEVAGQDHLSESTVLRTIQFRSGDVYRSGQLQEAQARLFGLEIIRSARVRADLDTPLDSVILVRVDIQEGDLHRLRAGAGWNDTECLDAEGRWSSRNFFGGGRRLQVRARVSNVLASAYQDLLCPEAGEGEFAHLNWLASVDLTQPWIFSTRNSFGASLFAERQSLKDVYIRETLGLNLALTRAIGPTTPLTLSYRPELSQLDAAEILFCINLLVCTPSDIGILEGANWLAPVGLNFTRNRTNNVLNPTRGYSLVLDIEHAAGWTGSNFRYDRVFAEGAWFDRFLGRSVIGARLRAGWVGAGAFQELLGREGSAGIVHPQKRFYAGGANSVRGFAQNRLGPRVLTADVLGLLAPDGAGCSPEEIRDLSCDASGIVGSDGFAVSSRATGGTRVLEASLEVRFRMGSSVQGAVFTDIGQVWGDAEALSLSDLQATPGVGVRYLSPIGPVRLDVAYRFQGGRALSVVTSQVAPYDPSIHEEGQRIEVVAGSPIPWVRTDELAILRERVLFGDSSPLSLGRLQLHFAIGQPF